MFSDYCFLCSGNEHIIVYACDCSSETLEKAEEIIDAATVASLRHRFRTFNCDFSITGFPKWLACHTCREVFMQKPQNCLSGFDLHLVPFSTFVLSICNMYSRFLLASPDAKENPRTMYPLNIVGCCIGRVDFITLVCMSLTNTILSRFFYGLWMDRRNAEARSGTFILKFLVFYLFILGLSIDAFSIV